MVCGMIRYIVLLFYKSWEYGTDQLFKVLKQLQSTEIPNLLFMLELSHLQESKFKNLPDSDTHISKYLPDFRGKSADSMILILACVAGVQENVITTIVCNCT